jgi:SAM-dependent methyltransferase
MTLSKVNVGCGSEPIVGWTNFDNSFSVRLASSPMLEKILSQLGMLSGPNVSLIKAARENSIQFADAAKHIPLPDKSVDIIYSCHMLEHLDRQDAIAFLSEAKRVLRTNGTLRVVVPDISLMVAEYLVHNDADAFIEATLMCQPRPRTLAQRLQFLLVGPRHHNWMYDGASLVRLLEHSGFTNVQVLPAGETTLADAGGLNLFDRSDESVYVEARAV